MFPDDESKVRINDENVMKIVKLADKMLPPMLLNNAWKNLSVHADEYNAPPSLCSTTWITSWKILDAIAQRVSIKELEIFAPEINSDCIYRQCLVKKICYLEKRYPRWNS